MVNGEYELKLPLDDSYDMFIEAFNFQGGQYKKMGDKKLEKVCKTLYVDAFRKEYAKFYETSLVKIAHGTCPVPVRKNQIANWMISDNGILPPYIPGGEKCV